MESLIEQRSNSDRGADPRIVRISVGVEDFEVKNVSSLGNLASFINNIAQDLKSDMTQALKRIIQVGLN